MRYTQNSIRINPQSLVMYIDMNCFFASCEQQANPELRGKPIGVCTHESPMACVIAPSHEAKQTGVKTGMRLNECRQLCPDIIPIVARPFLYRKAHIRIMDILQRYCDDVLPKSIDEAVLNLTSYRMVYKNPFELAGRIKEDLAKHKDEGGVGEYVKCSIGIAPNTFLAKLATDIEKPNGLVQITPENIDGHLSKLTLRDLPGIASGNERRLVRIGIRTPLEMRHASEALLRKAFGGIVGHYWHRRLNFGEVDMYSNNFRTMSATRTISREQRASRQTMESMLIALCTKLEQRMMKQSVFCNEASFFIRYLDGTGWDVQIRFAQPVQDAMELRSYIRDRIAVYEKETERILLSDQVRNLGVAIQNFRSDTIMQYSLFDNRIRHDTLRKAMYNIKDKYGKDTIRKAAELFEPKVMRDAIGFGSIKDMIDGDNFNKFALEGMDGYQ
jgi:DNA polymerase-4